jgi:hypothetical protein
LVVGALVGSRPPQLGVEGDTEDGVEEAAPKETPVSTVDPAERLAKALLATTELPLASVKRKDKGKANPLLWVAWSVK